MFNTGKPYRDQITPFNFVLRVGEYLTWKAKRSPRRFVAPFATDPAVWTGQDWYDLDDPQAAPMQIATGNGAGPGPIRVRSMRDVLREFIAHPEHPAGGPDGHPCLGETTGLLNRRVVRVETFTHIGKESNRLEDVQHGLIDDAADVYTEYGSGIGENLAADALADLSDRKVADLINVDADRIDGEIKRARGAALREARFTIPGNLTPDQRTAAIDALTDEAEAEIIRRKGEPTRTDHKIIGRWRKGRPISLDTTIALHRIAARRVAPLVGIDPTQVIDANYAGAYRPTLVLARWRDDSKPSPQPARLCLCGCQEPCKGKRAYVNDAHRKRHRRQQPPATGAA